MVWMSSWWKWYLLDVFVIYILWTFSPRFWVLLKIHEQMHENTRRLKLLKLFMVLFLCRRCRCGLHTALRLHIGILMRLLAAEPCSTAGILLPCHYLCGTILVTPYLMVWDFLVSRAGPMPFYWPSCSHLLVSYCFPFLFFHSLGWYWGAGVFGLLGC